MLKDSKGVVLTEYAEGDGQLLLGTYAAGRNLRHHCGAAAPWLHGEWLEAPFVGEPTRAQPALEPCAS